MKTLKEFVSSIASKILPSFYDFLSVTSRWPLNLHNKKQNLAGFLRTPNLNCLSLTGLPLFTQHIPRSNNRFAPRSIVSAVSAHKTHSNLLDQSSHSSGGDRWKILSQRILSSVKTFLNSGGLGQGLAFRNSKKIEMANGWGTNLEFTKLKTQNVKAWSLTHRYDLNIQWFFKMYYKKTQLPLILKILLLLQYMYSIIVDISCLNFYVFIFLGRGSLCRLGWPSTYYVAQDDLKPPASGFWALGLHSQTPHQHLPCLK